MAIHLLIITAITAAAILAFQIVMAESVKGKGLSERIGTAGARGFATGMGIMWAMNDQKLFSISTVFTQFGLGATVTKYAVEVCYMLLTTGRGSLIWLFVSRRFSDNSESDR